MAISETITGSTTSSTGSFQGNVDLSIKGHTQGVIRLEVQYPDSTLWSQMASWSGAGTNNINKLLICGDSTVLYRFRSIGVVGAPELYLGAV